MAEQSETAGWRIDPFTREYLDKDKREEEENKKSLLAQEEEGPSPLAMGLLQLGASMMRDEGWRDRPITLGESLGKAIPYGIQGYYNQDQLNRADQAERQQQQLLEQTVLEQDLEKQKQFKSFSENVESIPDSFFGQSPETASHRKQNLIETFRNNPEKGLAALNKIYEKMDEARFKEPKSKTLAEINAETKADQIKKLRSQMPMVVSQVMDDPDIPQNEKEQFAFIYGNAEYLTPEQLQGGIIKAGELKGVGAEKSYDEEFETHYNWLKKPENWNTFSPMDRQKIEFAALNTNKKESLGALKSFMKERQDKAEFQIIDEEKIVRNGRSITIRKEKNYATGEERTVEIDGAFETVKRTMSGSLINERYGKEFFEGINFDKYKAYNIEIVNGIPQLSGNIIDLTPDKASEYATDMRNSAVSMGLITDEEAKIFMSQPPADQIKAINKILVDNKNQSPGDPNAGIIKTGGELNKELDPEGKRKVYADASNYFWDGKKWTDLLSDQARLVFDQEDNLRTEYGLNTKKYRDSLFAYNSIVKGYENSLADPHAAGINDIMIVRAFLLMIEPNSVVRESEFATAARSQGLVNYSMNLLDKLKKGAILTKSSRARFRNAATAYMTAVLEGHKLQQERYTEIANAYNLSPGRIIDDPFANLPELKNFESYKMKQEDYDYLKNVKTIAPEGSEGIRENNSPGGTPTFTRE